MFDVFPEQYYDPTKEYLMNPHMDRPQRLEQCKYIVNELPRTEKSNASNKFLIHTNNKFHKSSNLPIMKKFREELEKHLPQKDI